MKSKPVQKVGFWVGLIVGLVVGCVVGSNVRSVVGWIVGDTVGIVGDVVGGAVSPHCNVISAYNEYSQGAPESAPFCKRITNCVPSVIIPLETV